jgi:hypothetical protein
MLTETLWDPEHEQLGDILFEGGGENLPGFEGLDKEKGCDSYTRDVPMAEAQI